MKKKIPIFFILVIPWLSMLHAQKTLTLKECYDKAYTANALAGEKGAYSSISGLKDANLSKGWLPTLDANGSFIYNSSVVDMSGVFASSPIPGMADAIKPLPHEQYKITMDINQLIYDGGTIKNARAVEKADLKINEKQTETDLYKLRSQINNYYFNILLLGRQKDILNDYLELINKRISSMQSALVNGMILKSDIDVMTAERIKLIQQINENGIRKASFLKVLSGLTGTEVDDSTELTSRVPATEMTNELSRPELQLYDLRKEQLAAGIKVIDSKRMPKAFGFATLGYGNPPGSNFFKDEFSPYYIIGASVKWNIFDWNKTRGDKQVIMLQQKIIENRKADLEDNLNRLLDVKRAEIASIISLIESDSELISIRKRISATAESQYSNGTITATEYLNELNSEHQALVNYEIHKINLSMARIEYLNISGKDVE